MNKLISCPWCPALTALPGGCCCHFIPVLKTEKLRLKGKEEAWNHLWSLFASCSHQERGGEAFLCITVPKNAAFLSSQVPGITTASPHLMLCISSIFFLSSHSSLLCNHLTASEILLIRREILVLFCPSLSKKKAVIFLSQAAVGSGGSKTQPGLQRTGGFWDTPVNPSQGWPCLCSAQGDFFTE